MIRNLSLALNTSNNIFLHFSENKKPEINSNFFLVYFDIVYGYFNFFIFRYTEQIIFKQW